MDFLTLGMITLGIGILLWIVSSSWRRSERAAVLPPPKYGALQRIEKENLMSTDRDRLRAGMLSLRSENPDLPAVPADQALYEFWFEETRQRIGTNAKRHRREAELKLASLEVQYEREKLAYLETKHKQKEILDLSDLEIEAKRQALLYQAEESKVKREALRSPTTDRPASAVRETESERRMRLTAQYERERAAELKASFAGRPFESLSEGEKERHRKINNHYDDKISDLIR